jgi:hypothetical protein
MGGHETTVLNVVADTCCAVDQLGHRGMILTSLKKMPGCIENQSHSRDAKLDLCWGEHLTDICIDYSLHPSPSIPV